MKTLIAILSTIAAIALMGCGEKQNPVQNNYCTQTQNTKFIYGTTRDRAGFSIQCGPVSDSAVFVGTIQFLFLSGGGSDTISMWYTYPLKKIGAVRNDSVIVEMDFYFQVNTKFRIPYLL